MGPSPHVSYPLQHRIPTDDSTGYRELSIPCNLAEQESMTEITDKEI